MSEDGSTFLAATSLKINRGCSNVMLHTSLTSWYRKQFHVTWRMMVAAYLQMLLISAVTLVVLLSCVKVSSIDMSKDGSSFLTPNSLKINR